MYFLNDKHDLSPPQHFLQCISRWINHSGLLYTHSLLRQSHHTLKEGSSIRGCCWDPVSVSWRKERERREEDSLVPSCSCTQRNQLPPMHRSSLCYLCTPEKYKYNETCLQNFHISSVSIKKVNQMKAAPLSCLHLHSITRVGVRDNVWLLTL